MKHLLALVLVIGSLCVLPAEAASETRIVNVTVSGSNTAALRVAAGAAAVEGSRMTGGAVGVAVEGTATLTMSGSTVSGSAGDGVVVQTEGAVTLQGCDIHENAGAGLRALRAENGLRVDDDVLSGTRSKVRDNGGDGIVLGDLLDQTGHISARIRSALIYGNEAGIRVRQKDASTAATTITLELNTIHDNRGSGLYIGSSFLVPGDYLYTTPLAANVVAHNAMGGPGCNTEQTAAQITFDGPVSVTSAQAAECSAASGAETCVPGHCAWTGLQCMPAYDMTGGSSLDACSGTQPNSITDYNTFDVSQISVGVFAMNGAIVNANINRWRTSDPFQNVRADNGFVQASLFCSAQTTCSY
jgi:hypothetical protein